jgi:hypothetical protein
MAATGSGDDMKRVHIEKPKLRREPSWPEVLPIDPRDPDIRQAKELARAGPSTDVASK